MTDLIFSQLTLITLICYAVVAIGSILWLRQKSYPLLLLVVFGLAQGLSYWLLVKGTSLPFWGLRGDEIFISALYQKAAHGGLFMDFAYSALPPFYPPFFFWLFSPLGALFGFTGIQLGKIAAVATFTLFPLTFYYFLSRQTTPGSFFSFATPITIALASILIFVLVPSDVIILKPYEFTSAALMILWSFCIMNALYVGRVSVKVLLLLGLSGGILFLWFYFWLFFAAIAVLLFVLMQKKALRVGQYLFLAAISGIIIVVASPYLFPLVQSYLQYGAENWQVGFTYLGRIAIHGPLIELSMRSLFSGLAIFVMMRYRQETAMQALWAMWFAPVIWQVLGLLTILLWQSPLQESKGFFEVHGVIYAISLAIAAQKVYQWIAPRPLYRPWAEAVGVIAIWLIALQCIFGTFHQDPAVIAVQERAVMQKEEQELVNYIQQQEPVLTLHSGVMVLHATTLLDSFIYFNMHASHPAANFSERARWLESCSLLAEPKAFATCLKYTPYGDVQRFIFFRESEQDFYQVILHEDAYPNGIRDRVIRLPKALFDMPYFDTVYTNDRYIVFEPQGV